MNNKRELNFDKLLQATLRACRDIKAGATHRKSQRHKKPRALRRRIKYYKLRASHY